MKLELGAGKMAELGAGREEEEDGARSREAGKGAEEKLERQRSSKKKSQNGVATIKKAGQEAGQMVSFIRSIILD